MYTSLGPGAVGIDSPFPDAAALAAAVGFDAIQVDVGAFLGHLDAIGYDGPVMVEPFSDELGAMDDADAARETMASLDRIWERAGL